MTDTRHTGKCEKGRDPKTCSPEQIRECHGDAGKHRCETEADVKADDSQRS